MAVRYCQFCGKEIDEEALFCPFCGKSLAVAQASDSAFAYQQETKDQEFQRPLYDEGVEGQDIYDEIFADSQANEHYYDDLNQKYSTYSAGQANRSSGATYNTYNYYGANANLKAKNKWISLLLCLTTGFGHKFYEEKYGMGILYIFTGGLFGIGWLVDLIKILSSQETYYV